MSDQNELLKQLLTKQQQPKPMPKSNNSIDVFILVAAFCSVLFIMSEYKPAAYKGSTLPVSSAKAERQHLVDLLSK